MDLHQEVYSGGRTSVHKLRKRSKGVLREGIRNQHVLHSLDQRSLRKIVGVNNGRPHFMFLRVLDLNGIDHPPKYLLEGFINLLLVS